MLATTETETVATLQSMAQDMGVGRLRHLTAVRGAIRCESPLQSELAEVPCVYYSFQVERETEETYYTTDAKGKKEKRTGATFTTVNQNQRRVPFWIEDASGQIKVLPDSAEMISETVLSNYEPAGSRTQFQIGKVKLNWQQGGVLGYRLREEAIPLDRELFVLGEVVDQDGELVVQKPSKERMIISLKPKDNLVQDAGNSAKGLKIGSAVVGVVAIVVIIIGALG
ncbi:MAG: hypothetical protein HC926_04610 [Synechococcaceae cyanobacterium SM2_3_60]|nr:hypothetical protein [Synechococcaceae cyanobacterium SM2_3_60]